jgi:hypothetical protein
MKRMFTLAAAGLLCMAASAWGAGFLCCGVHCIVPPPPSCPDCDCPCDRGLHHCSAAKCEHAQRLIEQLNSCECCDRIHAARKLGHRCHADFCCNPEVLEALIHALRNDSCWEVRKTAAWSIAFQRARTNEAVLALYVAAKLDPHYLVRDAATDALDVLLVCRRECFKDLFAHADELVKALKGKYKPGAKEGTLVTELPPVPGVIAAPAR